jgi:hypothetical protein
LAKHKEKEIIKLQARFKGFLTRREISKQ